LNFRLEEKAEQSSAVVWQEAVRCWLNMGN
jgi:hypothetical protein